MSNFNEATLNGHLTGLYEAGRSDEVEAIGQEQRPTTLQWVFQLAQEVLAADLDLEGDPLNVPARERVNGPQVDALLGPLAPPGSGTEFFEEHPRFRILLPESGDDLL